MVVMMMIVVRARGSTNRRMDFPLGFRSACGIRIRGSSSSKDLVFAGWVFEGLRFASLQIENRVPRDLAACDLAHRDLTIRQRQLPGRGFYGSPHMPQNLFPSRL